MSGLLLILSGPSGVGKDTLIDAWSALDPEIERVVACTTRAPREGEVHGVDYTFLSREQFEADAHDGKFLEWKEVHGNLYGTPAHSVEQLRAEGKTAILKIDVQGALSVMAIRPEAVSVFVLPPSEEELERRLRGRNSDSEQAVLRRLENALEELGYASRYDHRVVNDDLEIAVSALARIKEEACQKSSSV